MQGQGSCSSINLPPLSLKYSSYQFSAVSLFQWLPMTPTNRPLCWRPLKSSVRFPWMNSSFAKPNLWKHFESSGNIWRIPHLFLIIQVLKNLPQQATTVHPSKQPITVSPYIVMLRICSRVAKVYVVAVHSLMISMTVLLHVKMVRLIVARVQSLLIKPDHQPKGY